MLQHNQEGVGISMVKALVYILSINIHNYEKHYLLSSGIICSVCYDFVRKRKRAN